MKIENCVFTTPEGKSCTVSGDVEAVRVLMRGASEMSVDELQRLCVENPDFAIKALQIFKKSQCNASKG
jgi:hypothetical protein